LARSIIGRRLEPRPEFAEGAVLDLRSLQNPKGIPAMKSAITGKDSLMGFRASPTMRASVVRWAESQSDNPSLSEAIRRLVELGLTVKARPKQSAPARAERAKDLAAKVIDGFPAHATDTEETENRKRRLLKGPEEFRDVRVDRAKK
jgi:hypothetical protein